MINQYGELAHPHYMKGLRGSSCDGAWSMLSEVAAARARRLRTLPWSLVTLHLLPVGSSLSLPRRVLHGQAVTSPKKG